MAIRLGKDRWREVWSRVQRDNPNLLLRLKLSAIVVTVIVLVTAPLGAFTVGYLMRTATEDAQARLVASNNLVRDMILSHTEGLKVATEKLSQAFVAHFPGHFRYDPQRRVAAGRRYVPELRYEGMRIGRDDVAVDALTAESGNVASVFVRDGDDFVRVSTSLRRDDGQRAIGTALGKEHPAYSTIMAGKPYDGIARLFGHLYMAKYSPIKDDSNRVIGMLFVGMDLSDSIDSLKTRLLKFTAGVSGYNYVLDTQPGPNLGRLVVHPTLQGQSMADAVDADGRPFVRDMLAMHSGIIGYRWINAELGDAQPRLKIVAFSEYKDLGWLIVSGRQVDDILRPARNGRNIMVAAIVAGSLLLILVLNLAIGRWVLSPMLCLQRVLSDSERSLRTVFDNMQDAAFLHKADGTLVDVNAKMLEMYGVTRHQALQLSIADDYSAVADAHQQLRGKWARVLDGEALLFEWVSRRPGDGATFSAEISLCRCVIGGEPMILANVSDISARKAAAERLCKINRTLRVLSQGNEAIVHCVDEKQLIGAVCALLVETGGYRLAWIGLGEGEQLAAACSAGVDESYLDALVAELGAGGASGEPAVAALAGTPHAGCEDIARDYAEPLRSLALQRGLRSAAAFSLAGEHGILGCIGLYAEHAHAFDEEEVRLLSELAQNMVFGVISLRNSAARLLAEQALHLRNRAIESSEDGFVIGDLSRSGAPIVYINPACERLTGYSAGELLGCDLVVLGSSDQEKWRLREFLTSCGESRQRATVVQSRRKDGMFYWSEISLAPVRDAQGRAMHVIAIVKDVSERLAQQKQLEQQAKFDTLTGLANRSLLHDRLEQAIIAARRQRHNLAVAFIDLDHFKYVNDTLGHGLGDRLLETVAERLRSTVREHDTVARLGGDEFVVLLPDSDDVERVCFALQRLLDELARPICIDGHELYTTASIGVSLFPRDAEDAETILRTADMAMYRAKDGGRNNIVFYTAEMNDKAQERLILTGELRHAVERGELILHYQPQVRAATGSVVGVEALIRWNHPEHGLISPDRFVPIAEDSGLIFSIGEWVLRQACAQGAAWARAGIGPLKLAVNVSAKQFDPGLAATVRSALAHTGLPAALLEIELTESMLMHDPELARSVLVELKSIGVALAIDDFGTGYSSLAYLQRFPIDTLKIDQSFVSQLTTDAGAATIVAATIALAHSLRLSVVAEGVETVEQARYLQAQGCDQIQGYYYGRPVAPEAIARGIRTTLAVCPADKEAA